MSDFDVKCGVSRMAVSKGDRIMALPLYYCGGPFGCLEYHSNWNPCGHVVPGTYEGNGSFYLTKDEHATIYDVMRDDTGRFTCTKFDMKFQFMLMHEHVYDAILTMYSSKEKIFSGLKRNIYLNFDEKIKLIAKDMYRGIDVAPRMEAILERRFFVPINVSKGYSHINEKYMNFNDRKVCEFYLTYFKTTFPLIESCTSLSFRLMPNLHANSDFSDEHYRGFLTTMFERRVN